MANWPRRPPSTSHSLRKNAPWEIIRRAWQHAYYESLGRSLGYHNALPLGGGTEPRAGDVVFFNGLSHVALSLGTKDSQGRHEVMSLWLLPKKGQRFQNQMLRTTIEELGALMGSTAAVRFAAPPW